jgi:hypothetical protein
MVVPLSPDASESETFRNGSQTWLPRWDTNVRGGPLVQPGRLEQTRPVGRGQHHVERDAFTVNG